MNTMRASIQALVLLFASVVTVPRIGAAVETPTSYGEAASVDTPVLGLSGSDLESRI